MLLAQQMATNPAPSPWWNIIAAVTGAIVAGCIAVAGWLYVHRTSKNRDLENWRRTTLANAVTELIAVGDEAMHLSLKEKDNNETSNLPIKYAKMTQLLSLIQMCDQYRMWENANTFRRTVHNLINSYETASKLKDMQWVIDVEERREEYNYIKGLMTDSLARSVGLKPKLALDLDIAYVSIQVPRSKRDIWFRKLKRDIYNSVRLKKDRIPWTKEDEEKEFRY